MGNALVFRKTAMNPLSFRQWVACVVMTAVLFNTVVPLGVCQCEGCGCANNAARFQIDSVTADKMDCCCCQSAKEPLSLDKQGCCGSPNVPCSCSCSDVQKNNAIMSSAVVPIKRPDINPLWDAAVAASAGFVPVAGALDYFNSVRLLSPAHVPLHVFLCVFLN